MLYRFNENLMQLPKYTIVPKVPKTLLDVDGLSTTKNIKIRKAVVQKTVIEKKN
jgi:hypothetical protein